MTEESDRIARGLRVRLAAADLSQVDVGRILGLAQSSVSDRMRGVTTWRVTELARLSQVLGCTLDAIAGGDTSGIPDDSPGTTPDEPTETPAQPTGPLPV